MGKKKNRKIEEYIAGALLFVVFGAVMIQVVNRFLVKISIPWTEELARYAFIWLSFIGVGIGVKRKSHMSVELLRNALGKNEKYLLILVDIIMLAIFVISAVYGYKLTGKLLASGQKSPALKLSMGYVYLAAPAGFTLAALHIVIQYARKLGKGGETW